MDHIRVAVIRQIYKMTDEDELHERRRYVIFYLHITDMEDVHLTKSKQQYLYD